MYKSAEIAENIRIIAKSKNIIVKNMLSDCGFNKDTISTLNQGKMIGADRLATIADYLGVSVDYLLGRTDYMQQWICDVCGRIIENPKKGYVVWKYGDNYKDKRHFEYKILHPRGLLDEYGERYGCDNDDNYGYSASLVDFIGDKGLVKLLAMLDVGPLHRKEYKEQITNIRDFLELFRRVQLPYYEEARFYFKDAHIDGYFDGGSEEWIYSPRTLKTIIEKYKR